MITSRKLLILFGLLIMSSVASAQNKDILWQKTLTKDTIPISSIAIAEGKYVAALKGDEIIILDYNTGDSIKTFSKPKDMLRTDIFFGKNGERLFLLTQSGFLRNWDVFSGEKLNDINMNATRLKGSLNSYYNVDFQIDYSLDGKYIAVLTSYSFYLGPDKGSDNEVYIFKTEDSTYVTPFSFKIADKPELIKTTNNKYSNILSQSSNLHFSSSGFYLLTNLSHEYIIHYAGGAGGPTIYTSSAESNFGSFSSKLKSYHYPKLLPYFIISSDDDFLLNGNSLMNIPPTSDFRTLNKTGFVFLPDDNHMLAFKSAGGVAAISNIEKDTWEKVYQGDSLTENIIQTNATRTAFATASNNRVTLWKIPDTLQKATLTADFTMSKDSIPIFDSIAFTNKTFPMKRGTYFGWNFGDGSKTTSEIYPIHKFTQAGIFSVTLSVWDTLGGTSTVTKNVVVNFPSPKAGFTTPKDTVYVGNFVNFTNTTAPIRSGTTFTWQFSDGITSTEFNQQHQFFQTGSFTVKLTVQDTLGRKDSIVKTVIVINQIIPNGAAWINHFHYKQINSLAFSSNGLSIISGSDDSYSRVWDITDGKQLYSKKIGQPVYSVAFTKDSKSGIVGSYSIANNSPVYVYKSIANYANYMFDWRFTSDSLNLRVNWDIGRGGITITGEFQYAGFQNSFLTNDFSENQDWFIIGVNATVSTNKNTIDPSLIYISFGNVLLYNFSTNKSRYYNIYHAPDISISAPYNASTSNSFALISPDNMFYISLRQEYFSKTANILVKDINNDSTYRKIPTTATSMHFSPDKYHLLTNTGLWNIYDSVLIKTVDLPSVFAYHPDGIHVFALRADSTIGIYNLNSNSYEYIYPKQPTVFTALAVAPDGQHIATGDKYGYFTVWNVPDSLKVSVKVDFDAAVLNRSNIKTKDTITFANTTLPANNTYDYFWTFGDGTTSSERTPKHTFTKAGTFTVTLTAFQNGKAVDGMTKKSYITITGTNSAEEPQAGVEPRFRIVSNPSYGELSINYTLTQPSNIQITITDVLGREIGNWSLQEQAGDHSFGWNSTIGAGMYYCTFRVGSIVHTEPFVVLQ
ncbi:MAG: PKD domain-containing protein [Bacteroidetes bacterium]|nr:PKD domain-containing protein [Bacteroidota bacterium]